MAALESYQHRSFRFALAILASIASSWPIPACLATLRPNSAVQELSIGANIEEARSAYSRREMAAKYSIALREGRECHYWLRLMRADQPALAPATEPLIDEVDQLIAMLTTAVTQTHGQPSTARRHKTSAQ